MSVVLVPSRLAKYQVDFRQLESRQNDCYQRSRGPRQHDHSSHRKGGLPESLILTIQSLQQTTLVVETL